MPQVWDSDGPIWCVEWLRGSHHIETGLLLRDGHELILNRDLGGRWRLDAPAHAWQLVGQRVRIEGHRAGFDLLDVIEIERAAGRN